MVPTMTGQAVRRAGSESCVCSRRVTTASSPCFDLSERAAYGPARTERDNMPSVWQRLADIVGSASERTGVAGSLVNFFDPDNWLPGGKDAAFTLALIA